MATTLANGPIVRWVGNANGTPANVKSYAEGTSEAFAAGDIVVFDRSENGIVAPPETSGVYDSQVILGFALEAASGTAGTSIDVLIPQPGDRFSAGLATGEDTFVAPDQDNIGQLGGLIAMNAGNNAGVAVDESNTTWVKVLWLDPQDVARRGLSPDDATNTGMSAGDKVIFEIIPSVLSNAGAQA